MKKIITLILLIIFGISEMSIACTSAIITGKATPDGRPLMWKHRDTKEEDNRMVYVQGSKYTYIGLVKSSDLKHSNIWVGTNSAGFCIMNTVSYNLETDGTGSAGVVMRKALESCATIEDFEELLEDMKKPMGIRANFGVIDAYGGAAYYEASSFSYTKYDANDPEIAPNNYLIRSNYSFSGEVDEGQGYIRYENAKYLFENHPTQKFTPEWIFSSVTRSFYHSLLGKDLRTQLPVFAIDNDYIPRKSSVSAFVFQGVKKGEAVESTTMWSALGYPPTAIVVQLWVAGGKQLPEILVEADYSNNAPLCDKSIALKNKVFPIKRGNGDQYMHFALLYNAEGDGIIQKLQPVEREIFEETYKKIDEWNATGWTTKKISEYYRYLNDKVVKAYKDLFNL